MGFLQFIFSLMFVIPVGLVMLYLLKRLNQDMSEAVKNEAKADEKKYMDKSERQYGRSKYTPGYNKMSERPSLYQNPYERSNFGSSTAELRRRELKEQEAKKEKLLLTRLQLLLFCRIILITEKSIT